MSPEKQLAAYFLMVLVAGMLAKLVLDSDDEDHDGVY